MSSQQHLEASPYAAAAPRRARGASISGGALMHRPSVTPGDASSNGRLLSSPTSTGQQHDLLSVQQANPTPSPRTKHLAPPTPTTTGGGSSFSLLPLHTFGPLTSSFAAKGERRASFGVMEASIHDGILCGASTTNNSPRTGAFSASVATKKKSQSGVSINNDSPRHNSVASKLNAAHGSVMLEDTPTGQKMYADHRHCFANLEHGDAYLLAEGTGKVRIGCSWDHITKTLVDVDASALMYTADGRKVDHVSFGRRTSNDKASVHMGDERGQDRRTADDEAIRIDLAEVNENIAYIALVLNVYTTGRTLDDVANVTCRLLDLDVDSQFVPAFAPQAQYYSAHTAPPACRRRQSSCGDARSDAGGGGEISPAISLSGMPRVSLPASSVLTPSHAHEMCRFTLRRTRPKATGVVMLIFERLKATEAGVALRERTRAVLSKVQCLKETAASIRKAMRSPGPSPAPATDPPFASPPPPPEKSPRETAESGATRRSSTDETSQHSGVAAADEEPKDLALLLPGWRVLAAGVPVAGKTHRHVTAEVGELLSKLSLGRRAETTLPPEEACSLQGFRSRVAASTSEIDQQLAERQDMMSRHRAAVTGGAPDLTQLGAMLDDLTFVDQYAREMQRRRLAARGKAQHRAQNTATSETASLCSTRTPTPEDERRINEQFAFHRSKRNGATRPKVVRQTVQLYSVGRAVRNYAKAYYMDSDSSEEDAYLGDLFPHFHSRRAVRYATHLYNVGCRRDELYQFYLQHKATYAAAAREAVAREAAAQEAAWESFSCTREEADNIFDNEADFEAVQFSASGASDGKTPPEGDSSGGRVDRSGAVVSPTGDPVTSGGASDAERPSPAQKASAAGTAAVLRETSPFCSPPAATEEEEDDDLLGAAARRRRLKKRGLNPSPPPFPALASHAPTDMSSAVQQQEEKAKKSSRVNGPSQRRARRRGDRGVTTAAATAGPSSPRRRLHVPPVMHHVPEAAGTHHTEGIALCRDGSGKASPSASPSPRRLRRPVSDVLSNPPFLHPERRAANIPRLSLFDQEVRHWVAAYLANEAERRKVYRPHEVVPAKPTPKKCESAFFADLPPLPEEWTPHVGSKRVTRRTESDDVEDKQHTGAAAGGVVEPLTGAAAAGGVVEPHTGAAGVVEPHTAKITKEIELVRQQQQGDPCEGSGLLSLRSGDTPNRPLLPADGAVYPSASLVSGVAGPPPPRAAAEDDAATQDKNAAPPTEKAGTASPVRAGHTTSSPTTVANSPKQVEASMPGTAIDSPAKQLPPLTASTTEVRSHRRRSTHSVSITTPTKSSSQPFSPTTTGGGAKGAAGGGYGPHSPPIALAPQPPLAPPPTFVFEDPALNTLAQELSKKAAETHAMVMKHTTATNTRLPMTAARRGSDKTNPYPRPPPPPSAAAGVGVYRRMVSSAPAQRRAPSSGGAATYTPTSIDREAAVSKCYLSSRPSSAAVVLPRRLSPKRL